MAIPQPRRDPEGVEQKILQDYSVHPGGRILDIGCGEGRLTWSYSRDANLVIGLDVEMEDLRKALSTQPEDEPGGVYFASARGESLPLASKIFDLAIFSWSL